MIRHHANDTESIRMERGCPFLERIQNARIRLFVYGNKIRCIDTSMLIARWKTLGRSISGLLQGKLSTIFLTLQFDVLHPDHQLCKSQLSNHKIDVNNQPTLYQGISPHCFLLLSFLPTWPPHLLYIYSWAPIPIFKRFSPYDVTGKPTNRSEKEVKLHCEILCHSEKLVHFNVILSRFNDGKFFCHV